MTKTDTPSPLRVLLPVGIGTSLSLLGDASIYTVLPTSTAEAGVTVASLGLLLSVNRFVRLGLNGPAGMAYDRWRHRRLFVLALLVGAVSTAIYGLARGFWPLLVGRLLWGLAWSGIWIGGNAIMLDATDDDTRGRWVGLYQVFFFSGSAGGSLLGGFLTDLLGYHQAMGVAAGLTLLGALVALVLLPETNGPGKRTHLPALNLRSSPLVSSPVVRAEFASASALYGVNRFAVAGIFRSTFGLLLLAQLGERVELGGFQLGTATLTGIGLGLTSMLSMVSAPVIGGLSDRVGRRWPVAAAGLVPGTAGFCGLALGSPLTILIGVPLMAVAGGSSQGLATALIGDLTEERQGRYLGWLFTVGDLASAIGPPLAYALILATGVKSIYWLSAGVFLLMLLLALQRAARGKRTSSSTQEPD